MTILRIITSINRTYDTKEADNEIHDVTINADSVVSQYPDNKVLSNILDKLENMTEFQKKSFLKKLDGRKFKALGWVVEIESLDEDVCVGIAFEYRDAGEMGRFYQPNKCIGIVLNKKDAENAEILNKDDIIEITATLSYCDDDPFPSLLGEITAVNGSFVHKGR